MNKVAIIGAGSWGTALSVVLADKCEKVTLWTRRRELCLSIREDRQNRDYLPGLTLPTNVYATDDLAEAVSDKDILVLVTPSHAIRATARMLSPLLREGTILVNCAKGLEEETLLRMSAVLAEELPAHPVSVLSGPNHAEEVGRHIPTATVVSAADQALAKLVQDLFMTPYFRVYTNRDLVGVELAGALKNVIALGAGVTDGLGFGDNTKAALMTRGLTEIARLGIRLGADSLTFAGLAGIGDLMVTCTSTHSRNRSLGFALGQGGKLEEILAGMRMVAEGVRTTRAAWNLAEQNGVEMPITWEIFQVLFKNKDPRSAVESLMKRGKANEKEDIISF